MRANGWSVCGQGGSAGPEEAKQRQRQAARQRIGLSSGIALNGVAEVIGWPRASTYKSAFHNAACMPISFQRRMLSKRSNFFVYVR
eukprot:4050148-Pleurochrysis_carterae.AAC.3